MKKEKQGKSDEAGESRLIGEFEKNSREIVRASFGRFKGLDLFDLRVYAVSRSGEMKPTRKGISIQIEQVGLLRKLINAAFSAIELEESSDQAPSSI
jgi:hypothetical protein